MKKSNQSIDGSTIGSPIPFFCGVRLILANNDVHAATRDLTHPDYVDIDRGLFALHPCEPRLNVQGSEYVPVSGTLWA